VYKADIAGYIPVTLAPWQLTLAPYQCILAQTNNVCWWALLSKMMKEAISVLTSSDLFATLVISLYRVKWYHVLMHRYSTS